jgi:hypothetical protein
MAEGHIVGMAVNLRFRLNVMVRLPQRPQLSLEMACYIRGIFHVLFLEMRECKLILQPDPSTRLAQSGTRTLSSCIGRPSRDQFSLPAAPAYVDGRWLASPLLTAPPAGSGWPGQPSECPPFPDEAGDSAPTGLSRSSQPRRRIMDTRACASRSSRSIGPTRTASTCSESAVSGG